MFRKMIKEEKQLSTAEVVDVLKKGEYGVLGTIGSNDYPYTVPVNYVFQDEKIFFHCATSGHKIDNMNFNANVSFCVVGDTEIIPQKFNTQFKSVILFGKVKELFEKEKEEGLMAIIRRFSGGHLVAGEKYIKAQWDKTKTFEITIEHMSGKGTK